MPLGKGRQVRLAFLEDRCTQKRELGREPKLPLRLSVMRCSLWQHRNRPERVERCRTSVVGGVRADVVLEAKRQGLA